MTEDDKQTEQAQPEVKAPYAGKYKRVRRSDYKKAPSLKWLIDKVLPEGATIVMVGDPKCRKTFTALAMALAVVSGKSWCGLVVRKARALYVGPEDFNGLIRRQFAWEAMHTGGQQVELDFFPVAINLSQPNEVKEALDGILAQGMRPEFIVIDTLARATIGVDENDSKAMTRAFEILEAFKKEIGNPTVLIVHHTNKGGGYRGTSAIYGSADGMVFLKKDDEHSVLSCVSMRMAADFPAMRLAFETRNVETDDGWYAELTLSGASATLHDAVDSDEPVDTDREGAKVRTIIVNECRRLKWPIRSELEKVCLALGVTESRFDRHLKYLEGVGRLMREDDPGNKKQKRYRVNDGFGGQGGEGGGEDVYNDGTGKEEGIGIGIGIRPPKGGPYTHTHTHLSISHTHTNPSHTHLDKTGTLTPTTSSGTIPPTPLETGSPPPDHTDALTSMKELTYGTTPPGPAAEPGRKAGPQ